MLSFQLKSRLVSILPIVVIIAFYLPLYAQLLFSNSNVLVLTDITVPQLGTRQNLDFFVSTWHSQNFGAYGTTPLITVIMYLFLSLFNNPAFSQRFIAFAPMFLSSITMYLFLANTKLVKSTVVRTLASIFYGVNFLVLGGLSATSLMYTYAAIPVILLFAFRLFTNKSKLLFNVLGLSFSMVLASLINIEASIQVALIVFPLVIALFVVRLSKREGSLRYILGLVIALIASFVVFVVLTLPLSATLQYFFNVAISSFSGKAHSGVPPPAFVLDSVWYKQTFPSIVSPLLSLTSPSPTNLAEYVGLLIPLVILVPLFSKEKLKKLVAFPLMITILLCTSIIWIVTYNAAGATSLYYKFFFLQAFVEPPKWFFILVPCLCILIALGLDEIWQWAKLSSLSNIKVGSVRSSLRKLPFKSVAALLLIILVSLSIVLSDNFVLLNVGSTVAPQINLSTQGGPHNEPNYVPSYLLQLGNMFNAMRDTDGYFRVMWLPTDDYIKQALGVFDPSDNLFPPINQSGYLFTYITNIVGEMQNNTKTNLGKQLGALSIKYLVVLKSINQTMPIGIWYYGPIPQFIIGSPADFIQVLSKQDDLTVVNETSDYVVFENQDFIPMITSYNATVSELSQPTPSNLTLEPSSATIRVTGMSPYYYPSEYAVSVTSEYPVSLVLGQNYDPGWTAYAVDENGVRQDLTHFEANGWDNGFYVNETGSYTVEIVFSQQASYNFTLSIWEIASLLLASLFVLSALLPKRFAQKIKRSIILRKKDG